MILSNEAVSSPSLEDDVEAIALGHGRVPGSVGHQQVREHLTRRLAAIGAEALGGRSLALSYRSPTAPRIEFANIVGVIPGRNRSVAPVLLGAHYDSVIAAPCADDNAAAVAIALAAAEALRAAPSERDVIIALFDAEEPPYCLDPAMGSIRFYEDQRGGREIHGAIVMDLVGHEVASPWPALANLLVAVGIESSGGLPQLMGLCPRPSGLPLVLVRNEVVGDVSDHHVFRRHGVPYLFLTCGRWEHYHQPTDTPDRLAYGKMGLIRDYVVALARGIASSDLSVPATDTTEIEVQSFEQALGATLPSVLQRVGLEQLRTRDDLRSLALGLQALGL